jgi:hypothetical protein
MLTQERQATMCMILVSHHQDVPGFSHTAHLFPDLSNDIIGAQILEGTPVFTDVRGNRAEVIRRYGRSNTFSHLPLGKNSTSSLLEELDGNLSQSLVNRTRDGTPALEQPISKRKRDNITCVRELSCWHFPDQQLPSDESGQPSRLPSIAEFTFQMHCQAVTQGLDATTRPVPRVLASHWYLHQFMLFVWVKFVKSQTGGLQNSIRLSRRMGLPQLDSLPAPITSEI